MKVVLLPGLDGTGALHHRFVAALKNAGANQVLTCDVLSYPPNLSAYDDLQGWIMAKLPTEPFMLIAESFSGPLAIRLANTGLPHLKALAFVASFACTPRPAPRFAASALTVLPVASRPVCQIMQPVIMGRWASRAFTAQLWHALKAVPAKTISARLKQVLAEDAREPLARIAKPMIYLQARQDRLVPRAAAAPFAEAGATVEEIDGPHFLLQAQPAAAARHIFKFVSVIDW